MARRADAPRDLLFGLLALQNGMVNQSQLVAAFGAWTLAKDRQLGCTWQFGNAGGTGNSFGGDTQYGQITFNPPGAFTSQIQPNPGCGQRN